MTPLRRSAVRISLLLALAAPVFSKPPSVAPEIPVSSAPWKVGEKLYFEIGYGMIDAGEATLQIAGIEKVPGTEILAYHFISSARSTPFVDVFFKVRDRSDSWLDLEKWISHRFEQHNREGKWELDQVVEFDWKKKRYKYVDNVKGRAPKTGEGELTIPVLDVLSVLYATRAKAALNVGDQFSLDVHSEKTWPLAVRVLKREKVKVPAGKFECIVVEPFLREPGLFVQKGKKIRVWLTADERRLPVMMKAEVFIGNVSAVLTRIEGAP